MRIKPLIYSQVGTSNGMSCGGCRYFFDGSHIPKSTQRVGGCFLKFSKSTWYFFVRKFKGFCGKRRGLGSPGKIAKSCIMVVLLI